MRFRISLPSIALFTTTLAFGSVSAAVMPKGFCVRAKDSMSKSENELSVTSNAVFVNLPTLKASADCVFPLKLLRYGDADVLLTLAGDPDAGCHGCSGKLSAFVLARTPTKPKIVARFIDFGEYGSFGQSGHIDAVQVENHDAIVIAAGGVFQGFSSDKLTVLVFEKKRLVALSPDLPLDASNWGAKGDEATSVTGAWRIGNQTTSATITIDYFIETPKQAPRRASVTWTLRDETLVPTSGTVPSEFATAAGQ